MSVQRITRAGNVRYRARIKHHGREIATRVFDRRRDAEAWERAQLRALELGDWFDPRRASVPLDSLHGPWLQSLESQKRKTRRAHESAWNNHVAPAFGKRPLSSITTAQISAWVGDLIASGLAPATAQRYLATLRSVLQFAVNDARLSRNPALTVRVKTGGRNARREGQFLTADELSALHQACHGPYRDLVLVMGLAGLRWGEVAGLQVGDVVDSPGLGFRLSRAVIADSTSGALYQETLKGSSARTVPVPAGLAGIVNDRRDGRPDDAWLFAAPRGGPLSESNWRRMVRWAEAKKSIGRPSLRPHDLRHTTASLWLGASADPKVVQRVLGHASATMTMDLYGHLIDENLWTAAARVGGTTGAPEGPTATEKASRSEAEGLDQ